MIPLHPQYVDDDSHGTKSVLIPLNEWERIIEDLEELDDLRAYDAAKSEPDESIPFEQAVREIRAEYDS